MTMTARPRQERGPEGGHCATLRNAEPGPSLPIFSHNPTIHPRVNPGSHSCLQFHRDIITVGSDNRNMKTVAGTLALALSAASSAALSRPATAMSFLQETWQRLT
jgi:hypothetical protein